MIKLPRNPIGLYIFSPTVFLEILFFILLNSTFLIIPHSASAFTLSPPTASGLVGYWTFDSQYTNWSNNTTLDISGQGHTGTMVNMTESGSVRTGKLGQAFLFDGNITSVSVASNPITTVASPSSACAWAYTTDITIAPTGQDQTFLNLRTDVNNGIRMGSVVNTGSLFISYRQGGNYYGAQSNSAVFTNNTWNHVCYVWDGNGITMYANGNSIATSTNVTSIGIGSTIGARDGGGNGNWSGAIDDLRVYNRALTLPEIRRIYLQNGNATLQSVQNSSAGTLKSGLIGYWTFDGKDVVNGVALDKSGRANNGNLISIATSTFYTTGKIGQGFQFDGVDDYVRIPDTGSILDFTNTSKYSWSSWIKFSGTVSAKKCFLSKDGPSKSTANGFNLCIDQTGSTADVVVCKIVASVWTCSSGLSLNLSKENWYHIAITYDGASNWNVYKNGVSMGTIVFSVLTDTAANYFIGVGTDETTLATVQAPKYFWNGLIDDVRIYNRTLSQAEITQLYNVGASTKQSVPPIVTNTSCSSGISCGLVGYWTFDGKNVVNGVALDSSGNGYNGNLVNIATSTFYTAGKIGQGFQFDGVDDKITTRNITFGTPNLTVSVWVKKSSIGTQAGLVHQCGSGVTNKSFELYNRNVDKFRFVVYNSVPTGVGLDSINVYNKIGTWYHVVGVYNGIDQRIYVNGVLDSTPVAQTGNVQTASSQATEIGLNLCNPGNFKGTIDDVRIYNRTLSQAEINQLYNTGR